MRICLDTNAFSALSKGDPNVKTVIEEADEVILPAIVFGELMFGFLNGSRFSENEKLLSRFLEEGGVALQPVTRDIAERYGYVKAALKKNGTPIPENDIWIAATALETGSRLVTYDSDFANVGGLVVISP
ncbi:MAG: type II toxin-antitoxin system VapC family toxin [Kiritimatiellae bacterium]|nr:type II toxin-antitoxin system VapC family toxin [Kiritimatiellia bacterium]